MPEAAFLIPGDIATRTGGYGYDRRLLALLPACGVPIHHVALPGSFPTPSRDDLATTARAIAAQPPGCVLMFDGLAYGVLSEDSLYPYRHRLAVLVHHPLCLEAGLEPARQDWLFANEKTVLELARVVIATSASTRDVLIDRFGLAAETIVVAEPGTDPAARAKGSRAPLHLLAVGAIVPRKGYDLLVRALAPLAGLEWQLTIAGALDRDPACSDALRRCIDASGLGNRIALSGPIADSALAVAYEQADVFVMSSLFEGYGMVLGEAMARGLPIVCTTGGACAATAPDSAALKVPPGDVAALTMALRSMITDSTLRDRLGEESWRAGQELPRWSETARLVAEAMGRVGQ